MARSNRYRPASAWRKPSGSPRRVAPEFGVATDIRAGSKAPGPGRRHVRGTTGSILRLPIQPEGAPHPALEGRLRREPLERGDELCLPADQVAKPRTPAARDSEDRLRHQLRPRTLLLGLPNGRIGLRPPLVVIADRPDGRLAVAHHRRVQPAR